MTEEFTAQDASRFIADFLTSSASQARHQKDYELADKFEELRNAFRDIKYFIGNADYSDLPEGNRQLAEQIVFA